MDHQSICPRCRAKFECGFANGRETCWCFDCPRILPVTDNAECLCPDCLKAEIAKRQESQTKPSISFVKEHDDANLGDAGICKQPLD